MSMSSEQQAELDTSSTVTPAAAESAASDAAVEDAQQSTDQDVRHADEGDAAQSDREKAIRKLQRRIDNRTRALGQRDQEIADLRRQLQERQSSQGDDDDDAAVRQSVDVEQRAREIAAETRYRETIAQRTTAMLKAGDAMDKGFREAALEVAEEIPFLDRAGRPTPFIEAVLDTDAPAAVLLHLRNNPDLLADFVDMTPRQLTRKLTLLEVELAKQPPKRSAAPKPLQPVSGGGSTSKDEAAMSDAEWREQRRKQRA